MVKDYPGEKWSPVKFEFEVINECRMDISNYGRIKSFNKDPEGAILNGSMTNGYRIIRLKFFREREGKAVTRFAFLQEQVVKLRQQIKILKQTGKPQKQIAEATVLLDSVKKNLSKEFLLDAKKRTVYYHSLVHKLVAEHFCTRPSAEHSVVSHIDYNKLNNRSNNLKWMTVTENYAHQQKSPNVIAEKKDRLNRRKEDSRATKLSVTKVMLLKKLLNQGKSIRTLAKQFKVTDTQILRIKRGENWADIKAAS